jgi:hypothetical protein
MTDEPVRLFSRDYKPVALRRMLAGENVSALARELRSRRKYLYPWRERFRAGGPEAMRCPCRSRSGCRSRSRRPGAGNNGPDYERQMIELPWSQIYGAIAGVVGFCGSSK